MTTTYNDDDDDNNNINNTMRSDKENVLPSVKKSFSQFEHADDEYFDDDYAVCSDMLNDRNMFHCIAPRYHVPHVQRASPVMREMWDQPRAFRPIIPGHLSHVTQQDEGPCDSPRSMMSQKSKSQASSRASSRASGVNLNWLGDFMTKFVDDATSREKRDLDFMKDLVREKDQAALERERLNFEREQKQTEMAQQREQKQIGLALQREKEIRDDMRQLSASEARVAALQQQLHAQTFLPPDVMGEKFVKPRSSYFNDYPPRPRQSLWASSPKFADDYCTPVPFSTTATTMFDVVTPLSSSLIDTFVCDVNNVNVCQNVSGDTTTVSVLGARPTTLVSGGFQQTLSENHPVTCTPAASADVIFSPPVTTSVGIQPSSGNVPTPVVSTVSPSTGGSVLFSTPFVSNLTVSNAPSHGVVVSTAAETGGVPISSVVGVAPNVANVALPVSNVNVANPVVSATNVSSVPAVVVNTPKLLDRITGPQIGKASAIISRVSRK